MPTKIRNSLYLMAAAVGGSALTLMCTILFQNLVLPAFSTAPIAGSREIVLTFREELNRYRFELRDLRSSLKDSDTTAKIRALEDKLRELESGLAGLEDVVDEKDTITETSTRLATHGLTLASLIITGLTVIFALLVAFLGVVSFAKFEQLKHEVAAQEAELADSLEEMRADREILMKNTRDDRETIANTRAFVQRKGESLFSGILLEFVASLHNEKTLTEASNAALRMKINEVDARLKLWRTGPEMVETGVRALSAIGTLSAVPDLQRVVQNNKLPQRLKDLAQRAILQIGQRNPPGVQP